MESVGAPQTLCNGVASNRQRYPMPLLRYALAVPGLAALLLAFIPGELCAQDGKPRAVVSAFQQELLATMKEAKNLGFEGRYQRLLPAMELAFDFDEITRIAVGRGWIRMNKSKQNQVVDLFRRFSVSTYASALNGYSGEQFEIESDRAAPGLGTIIETRLVPKDDTPVEFDYLLRATPGGWKIVDVYLAGTISELARRRAEFSSIIQAQGIDGLIALLKTKNAALAGG
jgi:phospholipid transport system substrate-binding protein